MITNDRNNVDDLFCAYPGAVAAAQPTTIANDGEKWPRGVIHGFVKQSVNTLTMTLFVFLIDLMSFLAERRTYK